MRQFVRVCRLFTPVKPQRLQITDTALGKLPVRLYKPSGTAPKQAWPVLLICMVAAGLYTLRGGYEQIGWPQRYAQGSA